MKNKLGAAMQHDKSMEAMILRGSYWLDRNIKKINKMKIQQQIRSPGHRTATGVILSEAQIESRPKGNQHNM